jgi:RNA polymerase sigma-70 factor (sigma-E family)
VVVQQQEAALTALVEERGAWLIRCAYLLTRDHEHALDLTQDTLVRVWRAWDKVNAADHPERYVLRIMLNLFRDGRRLRSVHQVPIGAVDHDTVASSTSFDVSAGVEDADLVARALAELSERQRAVIVLRYWADYDDQVIAEVLGCRRATVRSIAARSLKIIQRHIGEDQP